MKLIALLWLMQSPTRLESAAPEKTAVKPGETINVTFKIAFDAGYHIYPTKEQDGTDNTEFKFDKNTVNVLAVVKEPATKHHKDEYSDYDAIYESPAEFVVRVQVPEKAKAGELVVGGMIDGQACNDQGCFPMELPFKFTLKVEAPKVDPFAAPKVTLTSATVDPAEAKAGDIVKLTVKLDIAPGWHIYSSKPNDKAFPTTFVFRDGIEIARAIEEPGLRGHKDAVLSYDYFEREAVFVIPVKLPTKAGDFKVRGTVTYQPCDAKECLKAVELAIEAPVRIVASAEPPADESKLKIISATFDAKTGKVGLKVSLEAGWHIYSLKSAEGQPTTITLEKAFAAEGAIDEPKPKEHKDPNSTYSYHEGTVAFVVPAKIAPETTQIKGTIGFMTCDANSCLAPEELEFTAVPGIVEPAGAVASDAAPKNDPPPPSDADEYERRGLIGFIFFSMGWGLFALIQPCVYPLIPITVTFFVKQSGESHAKVFFLAVCYALGIVISFTALGFLLTVLLGAAGTQMFASSPWTNLCIAIMFGVFALSMFGLFELKLPDSWMSAIGGSRRSGVGGAFILGLIFSVVSFTCTIQGTATILATAAGSSTRWAGLIGMLAYSATMAAPFLLFGIFPSLIKSTPKSGGWLHTVKVTGGFLEIGLAIAYIWKSDYTWKWGFFDRNVVLAIWIGLSLITALYLAGVFRFKGDSPNDGIGFGRMMAALTFAMMAAFLVGGYSGINLRVFNTVLPPAPIQVLDNYEDAEALAKKEKKPIFLEFTGVT